MKPRVCSGRSGFTAAAGNEIGQAVQTSYTDNGDGTTNGLPAGSYYYKLIAEDVAGNLSTASGASSVATVSADTLRKGGRAPTGIGCRPGGGHHRPPNRRDASTS